MHGHPCKPHHTKETRCVPDRAEVAYLADALDGVEIYATDKHAMADCLDNSLDLQLEASGSQAEIVQTATVTQTAATLAIVDSCAKRLRRQPRAEWIHAMPGERQPAHPRSRKAGEASLVTGECPSGISSAVR